MKISALICAHQDTQYITLVLEQIYDLVDEIILVDGPYRWLTESLGDLPFDHSSRLSEIRFLDQPLLKLSKVRYFHGHWQNEIEKRAFGYDACTSDLVLVVDADEIFEINLHAIEVFWNSSDCVGRFSVFSLARSFARAEYPADSLEYAVANANKPHENYRLFKRELISGREHVPYLQVLHPFQSEPLERPDLSRVHQTNLGMIFHLCVMRTGHSNLIKYLFYISAWRVEHNMPDPILKKGEWGSYNEMLKEITLDDYFSLLVRGGSDSIRCPRSRVITPFSQMPAKYVEKVKDTDDPSVEFGTELSKPLVLINNHPIFLYLPTTISATTECHITTEGVGSVCIYEYQTFYCQDNRKDYTSLYAGAVSNNTVAVTLNPSQTSDEQALFARLLILQGSPQNGKSTARICKFEFTT